MSLGARVLPFAVASLSFMQAELPAAQRYGAIQEALPIQEAPLAATAVAPPAAAVNLAATTATTTLGCCLKTEGTAAVFELSTASFENPMNPSTQKIIYHNIGVVAGVSVDMVAMASPGKQWKSNSAQPNKAARNGIGEMNFACGFVHDVDITFVKSGTTQAVTVPKLAISFYDMDGKPGGEVEVVKIGPISDYVLPDNRNFDYTFKNGYATFTAKDTPEENPTNAIDLTQRQLSRSATVHFSGATQLSVQVDLTSFKTIGPSNTRWIMFSLKEAVPECSVFAQAPVNVFTLSTPPAEASYENPNLPKSQALTLHNVGSVQGVPVDIRVAADPTSATGWKANNVNPASVLKDGIANLNFACGFLHTVSVSFVKQGTTTPQTVHKSAITFYDLDGKPGGQVEKITISPAQNIDLPPIVNFNHTEKNGKITLTALDTGSAEDRANPTSDTALTPQQLSRSATVHFADLSTFTLVVDLTSFEEIGPKNTRNIMISFKDVIQYHCGGAATTTVPVAPPPVVTTPPLVTTTTLPRLPVKPTTPLLTPPPTTTTLPGLPVEQTAPPLTPPPTTPPTQPLTPPPTTPPPFTTRTTTEAPFCKNMCEKNSKSWSDKCKWTECKHCWDCNENEPFPVVTPRQCHGTQHDTEACPNLPSCSKCDPKPCLWGDWEEWRDMGVCFGLCVRGRRIIRNSNECGDPCSGPYEETKACLDTRNWQHCVLKPTDCVLSPWSRWGACSVTKYYGQMQRSRQVTVFPSNNGTACAGSLSETKVCGGSTESQDCEFEDWNDWSECSHKCGGGRHSRLRKIAREAKDGGKPCSGALWDNAACNTDSCNPDSQCVFSPWSDWGECPLVGESKFQTKRKRILKAGRGGGIACEGLTEELQKCKNSGPDAPPENKCVLSSWGSWGQCDRTCGGGQKFRLRQVTSNTDECLNAETQCPDEDTKETQACALEPCHPVDPELDCIFAAWQEWEACSAQCGNDGVHVREREVLKFAADGGHACDGEMRMVGTCSAESRGCQKSDCQWGEWEDWSACSRTCGGGVKRRDRVVVVAPRNGGAPCFPEHKSEVDACSTQSCQGACIDGMWEMWTTWGICSSTCDMGYRKRTREIIRHPSSCGRPATGLSEDFGPCPQLPSCVPNIDCELSDWAAWSDCSCSCFGIRERQRVITQFASGQGAMCHHEWLKEIEPCNPGVNATAPSSCGGGLTRRDCLLSQWSRWSACPVSCGGAQKSRTRTILAQAEHGGKPCQGYLEETSPCGDDACSQHCKDCLWGDWSTWSGCGSCGGQQTRHRGIAQLGNYCGKKCDFGHAKEVAACPEGGPTCSDIRWCVWSSWSTFSECSADKCGATSLYQRTLGLTSVEPAPIVSREGNGTQKTCAELGWNDTISASCGNLNGGVGVPGVCGATIPPCTGAGTFETAKRFCESKGSRLCTEFELSQFEGGGQGCGLDAEYVWSQTPCGADGHKQVKTGACATEYSSKCSSAASMLGEATARYGKCCSNDQPSCSSHTCEDLGWFDQGGVPGVCGYTTSQCKTTKVDFAAAAEYCHLQGARLCSGPELLQLEAAGPQCGLDQAEVWTSSECPDGYIMTVNMGGPAGTPSIFCANRLGGVAYMGRCCADTSARPACAGGGVSNEASYVSKGGPDMTCTGSQLKSVRCADPVGKCGDVCDSLASIPCIWGAWSDWHAPTCVGLCERHRVIATMNNECGSPCAGAAVDTKNCSSECTDKHDCMLSDWHQWSSCDEKTQQKYRVRTVAQYPDNGGSTEACQGVTRQTLPCDEPDEGVDCVLSDWNVWSECSKECDGGFQLRHREIKVHSRSGGIPCSAAPLQQMQGCNEQCCDSPPAPITPKNCEVTDWSDWTVCQADSQQYRKRRPLFAQGGGFLCNLTALSETTGCGAKPCVVSAFKVWGECSKTCGGGQRNLHRTIVQYPENIQWDDPNFKCPDALMITEPCNTQPCHGGPPVNCTLQEWAAWGACSSSCGPGARSRTREFTPAQNGGAGCQSDQLSFVEACDNGPCDVVDCAWHDWESWMPCSKSCNGQRQRFRATARSAKKGGKPCCPHDKHEVQPCNTDLDECGMHCEDGEWSDWSEWETCSRTCGGGLQCRNRRVAKEANECGQPAVGVTEECRGCNAEVPCIAPVDCVFGPWTDFNVCHVWNLDTCQGWRERTRFPTNEPKGGGAPCDGATREQKSCRNDEFFKEEGLDCPRPADVIDCKMEEWSAWSTCSTTCDIGQSLRFRKILVPPSNGGKPCEAALNQTRGCKLQEECEGGVKPVDCVWGNWQDWDFCHTCDMRRTRRRVVTVEPMFGGKGCAYLPNVELQTCTMAPECKDEATTKKWWCTWGHWEDWLPCTQSCAPSVRTRRRSLTPAPPPPPPPEGVIDDASSSLYEIEAMQKRLAELGEQSKLSEVRRTQELVVAFSCGMISLVLLLGVGKICGRRLQLTSEAGFYQAVNDVEATTATARRNLLTVDPIANFRSTEVAGGVVVGIE